MDRAISLKRQGRALSRHGMSILADLRNMRQFCDGVIKVEYREFPIHRAIMSACSPYFRALFTNDFYGVERREVDIPGVSADIMEQIVDYAYLRVTNVTAENVEQLLAAADQFMVNGIVKDCCDFLISELCEMNCIGIRKFAHVYFCHSLERTAFHYLMQHFVEVSNTSDEFLEQDVDEICAILASDELNVKDEESVFKAILVWIEHSEEERKIHMPRLLRCIRLGLLTKDFFMKVVKEHPFIKENAACRPIVIETLKFMYDLDMDQDKEVDMTNPIARPRVPHEVLFVIGGWDDGSATCSIETYDTRADRWIICEHVDEEPRAYHGTACLDYKVYVLGGFNGTAYFSSVRQFDPLEKEWSEAAPMNTKRCYLSVAVLGDYLYAMGGYDGDNRLNSVERYLPRKNQWSMIQPMNQTRSDASATAAGGRIYICGGFNGHECLSTAEYYQPEENQWTHILDMRTRRSGLGVVAYRDCIYALGGYNGIVRLNTAEKYCLMTNRWLTVPEMYSARSGFAVEIIDDLIFTIGGYNGYSSLLEVECFDGTTDEWFDASELNSSKSGVSGCIVKGIANVQDYIYKDREKVIK